MKRLIVLFVLFGVLTSFAQHLTNYYNRYHFLMAPPSGYNQGLLGHVNPANVGMIEATDVRFAWNTRGGSFNDWGLFAGAPHWGFGMNRSHLNEKSVTDYSISTAMGDRGFTLGFGYTWVNGATDYFNREHMGQLGLLWRPIRHVSVSMTGFFGFKSSSEEAVFELGLRPLGTPFLTLFGDALIADNISFSDSYWSAGAAMQVVPGLEVVGRYFGRETFTVGVSLNLGHLSYSHQQHFDAEQNHAYNSHLIRSGGLRNNIFQRRFLKNMSYAPFKLNGRVEYQGYRLFDRNTIRFSTLLRNIRAAGTDPRIGMIAVNLSGLSVLSEHAWEIRQELLTAKERGKTITIFIDNADMTHYHIASVADEIVMDPQGMLLLPGYLMNRTYLKGTLEKLGLGFDEWRFFKYKSAAEQLSRDSMSEADEEQLNAYLGDMYNVVRNNISESRDMTTEDFDQVIDEQVVFTADLAMKNGLIDTLARWSDLSDIIKNLKGKKLIKFRYDMLWDNAVLTERWGQKKKIALVYGLGVCAMETGIRARWLEDVFLKIKKRDDVKAVVFRVDSPGGDGMASDYVAEALKECAREKPVIVTQGQVAGSGGYWISMYGDKIIAGPNTVTGSIGVIGGWVWDKEFSDKLGMSSDHVQRGEHSDVMAGVSIPLLGRIPARNLTQNERDRVEKLIRDMYEQFVNKVAQGRDMSTDKVRDIAQGRIYSGVQGKHVGLIDSIGGLMTAIEMAKNNAGIKPGDPVELVEIPKYQGLFNVQGQMSPAVTALKNDPVYQYLKMITTHPTKPKFIMPPDAYPTRSTSAITDK